MKSPELKDRLEESEKLIQEMTVTWEEKLRKTEEIAQERQKQLESLGISLQSSGIKVGDDKCFLVNLNADPALNELLVYYLKVPPCPAPSPRAVAGFLGAPRVGSERAVSSASAERRRSGARLPFE
ncbi:PREDICTED: kinesin-like protein KIF13B [Condylura cristata]|uniref:kinesin-like protein KIF13B n=1 Tax=Condylura cristata TaxID=143302 RepID=UPI000643065F|nr:PREDICTED: kinesin-like protein KIF13B [Condylura cristata]